MKRIIITVLALTLIAAMSIAAIAETAEFAIDDVSEETVTEDTEDTTEDDTALEEAEEAYRAAKQTEWLTEYEAELKSMVEAGTLTQDQADLLLANAKGRISLNNGECPNCGYEFGDSEMGYGKHGMKGGFGGRRH